MGRSWLGANVSAAMGTVLGAEGNLAEAERELATAENLYRDDVPTIHHVWLLVLITRVRIRRGRLDRAAEALSSAREALIELPDAGVLPALVGEVERELALAGDRASTGAVLEAPSEAELAVLRLLVTDLSTREIAEHLFLSANTVRSHPGSFTGSSAPTHVRGDRASERDGPAGRNVIAWVIRPRTRDARDADHATRSDVSRRPALIQRSAPFSLGPAAELTR